MRNAFWIGITAFFAIPWFFILILRIPLSPANQTVFSGAAIVSAAFLLAWGAEAAQSEIPTSLAVAFVALVAVLPEYAVDIYISAKAGRNPAYIPFAVANMTGANRLIIGVAWGAVVISWWLKSRKRKVIIGKEHKLEISLLWLATLYSFLIPLRKTLLPVDGMILLGLFIYYMTMSVRGEMHEPELEGPAKTIASLPKAMRRITLAGLFGWSFMAVLSAAKPFTEGLISSGQHFHVEPFLMIQILAPLATEAPELIVASVLAFRGNPSLGMGTLLASKLEQWTLLVGMVPIVYAVSRLTGPLAPHPFRLFEAFQGLALDRRQTGEIFLTSAQCLTAIAFIFKFTLGVWECAALFTLYASQFFFQAPASRMIFAWIYLGLALAILAAKKFPRSQSVIRLNAKTRAGNRQQEP